MSLTYGHLLLSLLPVAFVLLLGSRLRLPFNARMSWAVARMVGQLFLLGFVLRWVFGTSHPWLVVLYLAVMTAVAGWTVVQRTGKSYRGLKGDLFASLWTAAWLVVGYGVLGILRPEPWWSPQYLVPLLGMVLGNMLNGFSLGVSRFLDDLAKGRSQVEGMLSLGATRWEAARPFFAKAVETGLTPIVNTMLVAGIVSLPGMMTGQILAGAAPWEAVKYQIFIMALIFSATALGTLLMVAVAYRRLFNHRHQFVHGNLLESIPKGIP